MKANISTKWKYLLFFGLGSIIVGISLLAFGAAAGGIDGIKANTKAVKEVQTFDNIKNIHLETFCGITMKTGDVDKVTVTYYRHDKFTPQVSFKNEEDSLNISQAMRGTQITGFMELGGYALNQRNGLENYNETIITIPKNLTLNNLSGQTNNIHSTIDGLNITNFTLGGVSQISNTTIEKGNLSSYMIDITDSNIKNLSFGYMHNLSINKTTVENATFNSLHGNITLKDSTLKNSTINATEIDLPDEDEERLGFYPEEEFGFPRVSLQQSTLDNITYKGSGTIHSEGLTLVGNINFSGNYLNSDFRLTPDSRLSTSLDLTTDHGTINLDHKSPQDTNSKTTREASTHQQKIDKAKAELIIKTKRGYITLQ